MSDPANRDDIESGLASTLLGGFLLLAAAIGLVLNVQIATAGRTIMDRADARLHGIGTALVLACVVWAVVCGIRISGRGALAQSGRVLLVLAGLVWALFALGQAFVLAPLW